MDGATLILVMVLYMLTGHVYTPLHIPMKTPPKLEQKWCYYGSIQAYLHCPPGHGVKR